jgi:hypothetical protein
MAPRYKFCGEGSVEYNGALQKGSPFVDKKVVVTVK